MHQMYPGEIFRSPKNLSFFAIAGLALITVTDVIAIFVGFGQVANPTWSVSLDDVSSSSVWLLIQSFVYLLKAPLYLFTIVMFQIWLYRANTNLTPLRASTREYSAGWAIGWWFIPFANLVKPFQVVREVWCESDPNVADEPLFLSASLRSAPGFMAAWWAFWILSNIASNINSRVFDPDNIDTVFASGILFAITGTLSAIAALFAIRIVRDISLRQEARFRNLQAAGGFTPPPPPTFGSGM